MMKNANDEVNSTNSTAPICDAEMAAVLANSPWAVMEREAKNFATLGEFLEEYWAHERCA